MKVDFISVEEFHSFKNDLYEKLDSLVGLFQNKTMDRVWLKSEGLKKKYGISLGKQQYMRDSGELPYSKILGTCYYLQNDIEEILDRNKINNKQ